MAKDNTFIDSSSKKRKFISLVSIALFVIIISLVTFFASKKVDELARDPLVFREWIQSFGIWGKFVFVCLATVQVILAAIPGGPVQIAAGYAFGVFEGSILCTIGIQIGSAIAFLLSRKLGKKVIELFFSNKEISAVGFFRKLKHLDFITFICFLIPGAPKDLLTYFCGITKLSFWKFILITTVARLPSIIISVMSGNAISEQNYTTAIIIIASLIVCSISGFLVYKKFSARENNKDADTTSESCE